MPGEVCEAGFANLETLADTRRVKRASVPEFVTPVSYNYEEEKMNVSRWPVAMVAALTMVACAQEPEVNLEAEEARLRQLDEEWAEAAAANEDFERIVSYWSDDAVVVPPGQPPVVGREALTELVTSSAQIPGFAISWEADDVHISSDGQMAYMTGTNTLTLPDSAGQLVTTRGRGVTVWRKNAAGEWKCVYDMWNNAPVQDG